jgi:hypothetical protein
MAKRTSKIGRFFQRAIEVFALIYRNDLKWWAQRDLNPRPSDYESPALTAELWARPKNLQRSISSEPVVQASYFPESFPWHAGHFGRNK